MSETNKTSKELEVTSKRIKDYKETIKNDSLVTMGSMKTCEELFDKHKALISSIKDELLKDIQRGELSKECAEFALKKLDQVTQLIKNFSSEKLHHYYAKVGALNAIDTCNKLVESHQKEIEAREAADATSQSNKDESRVRPDDENTIMGKRLKNIRSKKKTQY